MALLRSEAELMLRECGSYIPVDLITKLSRERISRHVITAWEASGKARARIHTQTKRLLLRIDDLAYCVTAYLSGVRVSSLVERDPTLLGLGCSRGRDYPDEGVAPEEVALARLTLLDCLCEVDAERSEVASLRSEVAALQSTVTSLANVLDYGIVRSLPLTSPAELAVLLRAAIKDSKRRSWAPNAIEGWIRVYAGLSPRELHEIHLLAKHNPKEDFAQGSPAGLAPLMRLANVLSTHLKTAPGTFEKGTRSFELRRRLMPVLEEFDARVVGYAYSQRLLKHRSGTVPAGAHPIDIYLLDSLTQRV